MVESYISELLPSKYRKRHQLMLYLYDILVDILVKADKYQLSNLSFEFTNKIDDKIDLFDELELLKNAWLVNDKNTIIKLSGHNKIEMKYKRKSLRN